MGSNFFSLGVTQKDTCSASSEREVCVLLSLLPLMANFSVFMPLQGIAPGNSWIWGVSLKDYKIIWKMKIREMKTKQYLKTLIVLWTKWTGMVKVKHKDFIGAAPVLPCQNSSWRTGLRIYGEGRNQISMSSPTMTGPLARIQDIKGLYWYKNC